MTKTNRHVLGFDFCPEAVDEIHFFFFLNLRTYAETTNRTEQQIIFVVGWYFSPPVRSDKWHLLAANIPTSLVSLNSIHQAQFIQKQCIAHSKALVQYIYIYLFILYKCFRITAQYIYIYIVKQKTCEIAILRCKE